MRTRRVLYGFLFSKLRRYVGSPYCCQSAQRVEFAGRRGGLRQRPHNVFKADIAAVRRSISSSSVIAESLLGANVMRAKALWVVIESRLSSAVGLVGEGFEREKKKP